jgi:hypothetical protein
MPVPLVALVPKAAVSKCSERRAQLASLLDPGVLAREPEYSGCGAVAAFCNFHYYKRAARSGFDVNAHGEVSTVS